jgi:hypothetical protein
VGTGKKVESQHIIAVKVGARGHAINLYEGPLVPLTVQPDSCAVTF